MTYATLSIRRFPLTVTDAELEQPGARSDMVINLDLFAARFYPHEAVAWAKGRELPIHFVDSEWVRIVVGPGDLQDFADTIEAGADVARLICASADPSGRLVIQAEAF
jgi:hypothetical protein